MTNQIGSSDSMVARPFDFTAAQLFQRLKTYLKDALLAVGVNETVVTALELQEAMCRIEKLEDALDCKNLEN